MTNLEKVLGTALVVVSGGYIYTLASVYKHYKKEKQFLDEIQDECNNIKDALSKVEVVEK